VFKCVVDGFVLFGVFVRFFFLDFFRWFVCWLRGLDVNLVVWMVFL